MGIFRNQFFHNDIEHCAGGESQHERHDAQPSRTFCTIGGISRFMKNTKAEPRAVPRNGIKSAAMTGSISFV